MGHDDYPNAFKPDESASFGRFKLFPGRRLLIRENKPVVIGGRALDILIALVERPGQVLSHQELIERVWPNVTIDGAGLRVHLTHLRKILGGDNESSPYITNVPGRGYSFVEKVQRSVPSPRREIETPLPAVEGGRLPSPLARMIGRHDVVETLRALLERKRFISIVAPGGMGKTTVAVAVAHALLGDFRGAVCFVDLGAVTDETLVVSAVVSAVVDTAQTSNPLPALLSALADRRLLLILDNCEHVIGAVAPLAARIFAEASQVQILTTSREALRVHGESVFRLPPLQSPAEAESLSALEALAAPAVQLFMERAEASGHRIDLTDANASTVAGICRRLDGIALAIELAASRVGAYGIRGMADQLEKRFGLVWRGRRTASPRHQTMNAMLDWSYDLLSPADQAVLCRLAVFAGPFTLDGALAVVGEASAASTRVAIANLTDKSLIWTSTIGGAHYHRLFETTRAYAAGKLEHSGQAQVVAKRHAAFYNEFLASAPAGSSVDDHRELSALSPHLSNVRVALEWSLSGSGDVEIGVRLAANAAPMFLSMSLLAECERWCARALLLFPVVDRGTEIELALLVPLGISSMFVLGNTDEVRATIDHGMVLAETLSARPKQLQLLAGLSIFLSRTAAFREALTVAERIIPVAEEIGDRAAMVMAAWMIGVSNHLIGNQEAAQIHCERGVRYAAEWNIRQVNFFKFDHRLRALVALSRALWLRGQTGRALDSVRRVVSEATRGGHSVDLCSTLSYSIPVLIWSEHLDEAESWIEQLIAQATRNSLPPYHAIGIALSGELAVVRGDTATGVPMLRQALTTMRADRHTILTPGFCRALAEGLAHADQSKQAGVAITEALELAARGGESFDLPNLLRAQAEIQLMAPAADHLGAEKLLVRSFDCASRQSALGWQLRAAIPLARLWAGQRRRQEAEELLIRLRQQFETSPTTIYPAASRAVREDPLLFAPLAQ